MSKARFVAFLALAASFAVSSTAPAAERATHWPRWRGPLGNGVSPDGEPPLEWSETQNVRFKVPVPGDGLASPIVWEDRIFLLTGVPADTAAYERARQKAQETADRGEWPPDVEPVAQRFSVRALSAEDGSMLWEKTVVERVPHESHYLDASWANSSPVTDGEVLIAHFGSNGTYSFDLEGKRLWSIDLGDMTTRSGFGEGSSPALVGDSVVINWDHEGDSFIVALDKANGKERWRTARPGEITSWSTPVVVEVNDRTQVIVAATGQSRGYDLATGDEIWRLSGMTVNAIPTPIHRDSVVYLTSGYRGNVLQAIDLERAKGDLAGTPAVIWTLDRHTPYVASPILHEDHLYFAKSLQNIFSNVDPDTGEFRYTERLPGISRIYASPLAAAGKVYVFGREGTTVVLRHGTEFEVLAENRLEHGIDATPAIVGKRMYVRTRRNLYCLEEGAGGPEDAEKEAD